MVHRLHGRDRRFGHQTHRFQPIFPMWPHPNLPYGGKGKRGLVRQGHMIRHWRWAPAAPFIKPAGRYQAFTPAKRAAERRLIRNGFTTCIDQRSPRNHLPGPGRHQPPLHQCHFLGRQGLVGNNSLIPVRPLQSDHRHRLHRGNVKPAWHLPPRGKSQQIHEVFISFGRKRVSAAHFVYTRN